MRVLIIEDDPLIAELESDFLEREGFETVIKANGWEGKKEAEKGDFDAIVIDIMLPGIDGYMICREIRKTQDVPILLVTAKKEEEDKLKGFGLGIDDYIEKPFNPVEFVERVKAHIAIHTRLIGNKEKARRCIHIRNLEVYPEDNRILKNNEEVQMPHKEFQIVSFLAQNPNIVFSKEYIMEKIWGYETDSDTTTVTVHIKRIREKIEDDPSNPEILRTVWGAGYKIVI